MLEGQIGFGPVEGARLRVLSFGGGVQSSGMLLMACRGELSPRPDHVIFADTGFEPAAVYAHVAWCKPLDRADLGDERTGDLFAAECEGMCGV